MTLDFSAIDKMKDDVQEEQSEEQSTNVHRRPKAYQHLTDAQYNRCILRERFVGLALCNRQDAVRYLRREERRFRLAGFDDRAKQEMYRALTMNGTGGLTMSDLAFCDSMFGRLTKSRPTPENTQVSQYESRYYRPMPTTPLEWVKYHRRTTFENFRNWASKNPDIVKKLDKEGLEELTETIDTQVMEGHVLPFQKEYTPEDDDAWLNELRASIQGRMSELQGANA